VQRATAGKGLHPAAEWALETAFGPVQVDCTTAVVLKILDNKCKMLPGEKAAVMAVYDVVKNLPAELFDAQAHETITRARALPDISLAEPVAQAIHLLRVDAEAHIPKPVMKAYKALLREGLFG
jgi:hypothetical protein